MPLPLVPLATRAPSTSCSPGEGPGKGNDDTFYATYPSVYKLSGPPHTAHVAGTYHVRRRKVHGLPIWTHEQGQVIFSDSNGGWTVGESMRSLKSGDGVISSQHAHSGALPHAIPVWCYGTGQNWVACADIEFVPSWAAVGDVPTLPAFGTEPRRRMSRSPSRRYTMRRGTMRRQSQGASHVPEPADVDVVGGISDFQVDYPKKFGTSCLTSKELRYLKECYDEQAASLPLQPAGDGEDSTDALLQVLHRIGVDDVDTNDVQRALAEARRVAATSHSAARPETARSLTGGLRKPMTLAEFMLLCDVLKAAKMEENALNTETLEAFVAMGGNSDRSGGVSVGHLQSTASTFDIDMASSVEKDVVDAVMDFTEFHSMLSADGCAPDDVFAMAGGDPMGKGSAVPLRQLCLALDTLKEVGAVSYPDRLLQRVKQQHTERSALNKYEFIVSVWKPLGLSYVYGPPRSPADTPPSH